MRKIAWSRLAHKSSSFTGSLQSSFTSLAVMKFGTRFGSFTVFISREGFFSIFEKRLECDWKVSTCRIEKNVSLKEYADAILVKYCERELYDYRCYTSNMTPEKYDYLCKKYKIISDIIDSWYKKYRESGVNEELLLRKKYNILFGIYEDSYERTWTSLNWGIKENESLASFADGALHQEAHGIK